MKKASLRISMCVVALLSISGMVSGSSLPGDYNGDWKVDLQDLAVLASNWTVDWSSLFIMTWDTSLGDPNTVTLALAGTVDAEVDWGDGNVETVTAAGSLVHDYGTDGVYVVKISGVLTGYDNYYYGGSLTEKDKLISVDNWGKTGFTSLSSAFAYCSNLVSVPATSDGLEAVTDMNYLFYDTSSFNSDIRGWDTFNVTSMNWMFYNATSFNQDLSGWCVTNIPSEPFSFDYMATSWIKPEPPLPDLRPIWGTCP